MSTLSDAIERYLKRRLAGADGGVIEIRRAEVAEQFDCVPSQINYVLETRFTPQRGYYVESRRGGGGYIRILGVVLQPEALTWEAVVEQIGKSLSMDDALTLLQRLIDRQALTLVQAALIRHTLRHETTGIDDPVQADRWRATMLRAMLLMVWHGQRR